MKKRIRIHPVFWIPILVVIFLAGYKIREAYYSHEAHIKYVRNEDGTIEWEEMYKRIKHELKIKDDDDFYFFRKSTTDSGLYRVLDDMVLRISNRSKNVEASASQYFMKEFEKGKFYVYYFDFWDDYIEIKKLYPKLVDKTSRFDYIYELDSNKVAVEVPNGKMIFNLYGRMQEKLFEEYRDEGMTIYLENKHIHDGIKYKVGSIVLFKEDEEIITQEKDLEEGVYLIAEIKSLDQDSQWIYYKIKK